MSTTIMFADRIDTAADLQLALTKLEMVSGQNLELINLDQTPENDKPNNHFSIQLEKEILSDYSIVYNAYLGYLPYPLAVQS